ncbi:MAG TPA: tetratricopeptide repeat protein [Patescibacteria group bacterium]|nr:tetratricopeptide repeat protein [Patescibacteria group bacterium]
MKGKPLANRAAQAAVVSVFVLIALLSVRQVGSLDTGFHLKAGERLLQTWRWPDADPFTFTLGDRPYVDTSWGYQLLVTLAQRALDAPGLVILHGLLILAVFFTLYRTSRLAPSNPAVLAALLLIACVASEMRFEARPELVSWLLLAIVLHILHRHAEGRTAPLPALVVVHLIWANMHSLFVLGWVAIGCFIAGLWLRQRRLDTRLLGWGIGSMAITLINPYGWRGTLFPFTLATRLQEGNVFAESIGEFVSPFNLGLSRMFPFYPRLPIASFRLFALLAVIACLLLIRQKRFWSCLLMPVFMALAFRMIRNIPLLVVAGLPAVSCAFSGALGSGSPRRSRSYWTRLDSAAPAAVMILSAVLGLRVIHDGYYIASRRTERFGLGWNRLVLPVEAAQWATQAGLNGPMLNHLNFGGYFMWARPQPVFIDGRLEVVGETFYRYYQRVLGSPAELEACVAKYGIRWMVFPYATNRDLLVRLSKDAKWRLAYFDHLAAIFVRADGAAPAWLEHPTLDESTSPGAEGLDVSPVAGLAGVPGIAGEPRPGGLARWMAGLARRQIFPTDDFNRGLFRYFRGELDPAGRRFVAALRASGGAYYEIYYDLGAVLYQERRFAEAAACYRIVLEDDPENVGARDRLASIRALPAATQRTPR